MMSAIGRSRLFSNRRSRLVRMPTSRPSLLPSCGDRHAGDPVLLHQLERFEDPVGRGERDRVDDHAALGALDPIDFGGLFLDRQVLVDDPDAALLRHRDRQPRLGDGVHRRAEERHVDADVARDPATRRPPALGSTCECRGTSSTSSNVSAVERPTADLVGVQNVGSVSIQQLADHGTSCISCRCRTGTDRCGRPSARRASPA